MPAFFEGRDAQHEPGRGRVSSDLVRYHQPGTASGWVSIGTERFEIKPDEWFAFRDHSWGTREHVGLDPTDLVPHHHDMFAEGLNGSWFVSQIQRPDGSFYEAHVLLPQDGSRSRAFQRVHQRVGRHPDSPVEGVGRAAAARRATAR